MYNLNNVGVPCSECVNRSCTVNDSVILIRISSRFQLPKFNNNKLVKILELEL